VTAGAYAVDRDAGRDVGVIVGAEARLWRRAGLGAELRAAPEATTSPRWSLHVEGEGAIVPPVSGSCVLRWSRFADLTVLEVAPGAVVYLPRESWIALRGHLTRTEFLAGAEDALWGGSLVAFVPVGRLEARAFAMTGGESYLAGAAVEPRTTRARSVGLAVRLPWSAAWRAEVGSSVRLPERGEDDLTLHAGLRRRW
jgi:YaiO family outer membrane protein